MRVLGALLCVVGLVVGGLAAASATVWRASDTLAASATAGSGSTLLVTDPGILDLAADEVTVSAEAQGAPVVVALGRSVDVDAWVGDSPATRVTGLVDRTTLATDAGPSGDEATSAPTEPEPSGTTPAEAAPEEGAPEEAPAEPGAEGEEVTDGEPAPDPRGADLWVEEVSGEDAAELRWEVQDGRWSVLVASTDPDVPPTVTLSWPQTVATPWLVPGLVVGGLLLLAGAALLLVGLLRARPTPATAAGGGPVGAGPALPADAAPSSATGERPLTRRELRERQARVGAPVATVPDSAPDPSRGTSPVTAPGAERPAGPTVTEGDAAASGARSTTPQAGPSGADAPGSGARPEGPALRRGLPPAAGRLGPRRPGTSEPGAQGSADPGPPSVPGPSPSGPSAPGPSAPRPATQGPAAQGPATPGARPAPGASAWRQTWGLAGGTPAGDPAAAPPAKGQEAAPPATERGDEDDTRTTDDGGAR